MTIQLRDYQLKAIDMALPHDGFGLFMEQRTGKTLTSLALSQKWSCTKTLVICPKKAIPVWSVEIQKLGIDLSQFNIINFESFRIRKRDYINQCWDLVIVDESHRIKERGSKQTQAIWKLSRKSLKRLILSGSPQGNGMEDYYSQSRIS